MNKYLDISPEVSAALAAGKPVVALESTIISHGMPYPQNVKTALEVEQIIRDNGAVPATIAIIGGRLKAGLTPAEIEYFGKKGPEIAKASRRDLPVLPAEMVNTTGCGDAFMAAITWAYLQGTDLEGTAKAGLAASAIAMEGAETINPAMSEGALRQRMAQK